MLIPLEIDIKVMHNLSLIGPLQMFTIVDMKICPTNTHNNYHLANMIPLTSKDHPHMMLVTLSNNHLNSNIMIMVQENSHHPTNLVKLKDLIISQLMMKEVEDNMLHQEDLILQIEVSHKENNNNHLDLLWGK